MASGGVIPHADGFIATGPTMISPHHMVGEAGAEAVFDYGGSSYVVPLTNRKYSAPFADVVAQQVARRLGGGSGGSPSYVNVTVDGNGTTKRVEQIVLDLLDALELEAKI